MSMTRRITEETNLAAVIASVSGTGSYYSDAISLDAEQGRRFVAYVNVGTIGASATVDFEFRASATSGGTYTTISGTAITQDVAGSKIHQVEVSTEQIKALVGTAKYLKGYLKTLVAATPTGVTILGRDTAHIPVTNNCATVGQTVTTVS